MKNNMMTLTEYNAKFIGTFIDTIELDDADYSNDDNYTNIFDSEKCTDLVCIKKTDDVCKDKIKKEFTKQYNNINNKLITLTKKISKLELINTQSKFDKELTDCINRLAQIENFIAGIKDLFEIKENTLTRWATVIDNCNNAISTASMTDNTITAVMDATPAINNIIENNTKKENIFTKFLSLFTK